MFWIAPIRVGDLRYQSSLKSLPVSRLSSPDGNTSGTVSSCGASNFNGSSRSFAGRSATVAWLARVSRPRPKCAPVVTASNHETDSAYFSSSVLWRAMSSARLSICSVSTLKYAVSTWCSCSRGAHDHPGEPHPGDGGPEQVVLGRELVHPAIRRDQRERPHVVAEAADDVVGLAVDVGADRAADRDLAGARQHRQPQAVRQRGAHQRVEAHARVDVDEPALGVDRVDLGEARHGEHGAARVLRGIAVGAAQAARDDARGDPRS